MTYLTLLPAFPGCEIGVRHSFDFGCFIAITLVCRHFSEMGNKMYRFHVLRLLIIKDQLFSRKLKEYSLLITIILKLQLLTSC